MNATLIVAKKELRALFQSPIALIFLGVFLACTLALFFGYSKFFARNIADARPLFEWLPLLLIFLVSAITMRSWAEERRAGTLELLLTLPVPHWSLILGKFFAGMALVVIALACTLPLPITVAFLGPLDWGPVLGGYLGAVLLGSAYMAIGLCVSSRTDNQVVALMVTLTLGGLLYLVGSDPFTSSFNADQADFLRGIGTGSRFESIERGVIDLRDLLYYGSVTAFFLVLNGVFIGLERLDTSSESGRSRAHVMKLTALLVGLNAVALAAWTTPLNQARVDLTAEEIYSIHPASTQMLGSLDEPLRIYGLFSDQTHPFLAPLIPQIRDQLTEYALAGGSNVELFLADPATEPELAARMSEEYGIEPVAFSVTDRHAQSMVNAYFHVLLEYKSRYEILTMGKLVEVHSDDVGVDVQLKSLEYDLTKTIRKISQQALGIDEIVAKLPENARITLVTTNDVPEAYSQTLRVMKEAVKQLETRSNGKITVRALDPSSDSRLADELLRKFRVRPLSVDVMGNRKFYLHLIVECGDVVERIQPQKEMTPQKINRALFGALRRAIPGQVKKIALVTEIPVEATNADLPPEMRPPPPRPDYRILEGVLKENYEIETVDLMEGFVVGDVDLLIVGKTGALNARQLFAIDQFLMMGRPVIALAGAHRVKADSRQLNSVIENRAFLNMLEHYGVYVETPYVMDEKNAPFPLPSTRKVNGIEVPTVELTDYPYFIDIRGDQLNNDHAIGTSLTAVSQAWASPLTLTEEHFEDRTATWLLRSSPKAWLDETEKVRLDFNAYPGKGYVEGEPRVQQTLALVMEGDFSSYFADKDNPLYRGASGAGRTIVKSVAPGRLTVFGSSEFIGDLILTLASQSGTGEQHRGNIQLLQNAIDWSMADTELLEIRTSGSWSRTLRPMEESESRWIEMRAAAACLFPLLLIILLPMVRRSQPIVSEK